MKNSKLCFAQFKSDYSMIILIKNQKNHGVHNHNARL